MTHLTDLQDSIQAAENQALERSEEHELHFAAEWQVVSVSILVQRALTEPHCTFNPRHYVHRDIRIAALAKLFKRDPEWFTSSRLMSYAGASRLLELAYGIRRSRVGYHDAKYMMMYEDVILAVQEAAEGLFEAKYPNGKVVRKVTVLDREQ